MEIGGRTGEEREAQVGEAQVVVGGGEEEDVGVVVDEAVAAAGSVGSISGGWGGVVAIFLRGGWLWHVLWI